MAPDEARADFLYVDADEQWGRVAPALGAAHVLAVDTEADSMHSYFEKVCLVQLATDEGNAFVLDPLALTDLAPLAGPFSNPDVVIVFHGADFDVSSLRRDFEFEFRGLFDTMVAAQLLGDEQLSLRDLVQRFFDVTLEKAHTRADWGRRPLSQAQIEYSYLDVAYLVELYRIQHERLAEADLLEEARIEFERLADREAVERTFDPHGWARIKGSRDLETAEQAVLTELFALRDRVARRLDRPAFKVLGNDAMLRISRLRPGSRRDLTGIKGVSGLVSGRLHREVLTAVERGIERGEAPERPRRKGDPRRRLDFQAQKRLGKLRDWRNEAAESNGVTTLAILPNYAMFEVARVRPHTADELAGIAGVGERRVEKWGSEILGILR